MSKKKKKAEEEETGPPVISYREKFSRRDSRRAVTLRPKHSRWTLLWYVVIFVVAFWFLHYVMKIG